MIITQDKRRVVQSHDFDEVNCTIDAEDMRYVASLLRNNYSNPSLAVIREITANAIDANKEANSTKRVEVKLPSSMNPTFCVRDYGSGLSQGDIFGLYSKYGKSTKRTSNSYIGAFGIGKFAPLSYGDNFSVVSYHKGERKTYNVYVNEQDDTKISLMESVSSKEPSGLEVQVAVADNDISKFKRECLKFFEHFEDDRIPILKGLGDDEVNPLKKSLEGDKWFIAETDSSNYYQSHNQSYAIMGGVAYPVNSHSINFDNIEENKNNHLHQLLSHNGLYMNFDLGELKLHHSRESLEYNKGTQKVLIDKVIKIKRELSEIAKEKLAGSNDFWEAKMNYARIINALPRQIRGVLESHFTWKGHRVDSFSFCAIWEDGNTRWRSKNGDQDMYINRYIKVEDENISDGFKVQNNRESTIYVKDGALVAINDCDNSAQLALRIRTILKENPDAIEVYVLRFTTKSIKKKFYDEQQFKLVDKDFVYSLRNVDKAKVKGSKGSSSGSGFTRQNIKLFKFNSSKINEVGAGSAWEDVKESPDSEVLYVPLFNYKIVDKDSVGNSSTTSEKVSLRELNNMLNALENHKVDIPSIYGLRRKDCEKLSTNFKCAFKWIVEKAESILDDDSIYEKKAMLNMLQKRGDWKDYYDYGKIITSENFVKHMVRQNKDMKSHSITKFFNLCQSESELRIESMGYGELVGFVEEITNTTKYSERLSKVADDCELKNLFNEIKERYDLFEEIQFYGHSAHAPSFDRIIKYIKVVDRLANFEKTEKNA
jgi:hypothetical protein